METHVGQTVSHYAFLEKLGSGGMGEIYKARDSRLNRFVAVKVLTAGRTGDPQRRRRFIQEARAASALNHPNIVTIHDILPEGDTQYMVMEHVSGETLQQMIRAGRLPVPQALRIAAQMANALAAAHAAGIIHRDFKPANVMVTSTGLVKVLDFGLAKLLDPAPRRPDEDATLTVGPLTAEGAILGTVNYMSPEQAEGVKVDARSDIFSFGAVLYEMVTGRRAFEGESTVAALSAVLRDQPRPIREVVPETPAGLDALITRSLRKRPDERWQSMSEVAAALLKITADLDTTPPPAQPHSTQSLEAPPAPVAEAKPRRTRLLVLSMLAALALGSTGAWWQMHRQVPQPMPSPVAPATPAAAPPSPPATSALAPSVTTTPASVAAPKQNAVPNSPTAGVASPAPAPSPPVPAATTADLTPVKLNDGLPFRIALIDDVPLNAELGRMVRFRVIDDVQAGPVTVIPRGAIVTGSIAALGGKRNFFGERSKVKFRLLEAAGVNGARIGVRATPRASDKGESERAFATPNESGHDLKENNLIAAGGTEYIAYIAGDQTVNVPR